jgi:hypothetical protein
MNTVTTTATIAQSRFDDMCFSGLARPPELECAESRGHCSRTHHGAAQNTLMALPVPLH